MTDMPAGLLRVPPFNDGEYTTDTGRWSCLLRR